MSLSVGLGNGLMFREDNGQLPSFDNTLFCNEIFINTLNMGCFDNIYYDTDNLAVQIKVTSGDVPTMTYYDSDGNSGAVALTLKTSYTDWDFYESNFSLSTYTDKRLYFVVQEGTEDDWTSEQILVIDADEVEDIDGYHKLEWYNLDPTTFGSTTENFEMDYSTGITPFIRLPLILRKYEPELETSVYENLDEVVKLREKVKRTLVIETDAIPRYLTEKLSTATAHDKFYVNEVEFVRKEAPEITNQEGGNLAQFSAVLTQAAVKGLNTSDIGFDCDNIVSDKWTNLIQSNVTVNTTFTIPEDALLAVISASHNGLSATNTLLKFGRTVGGDDLGVLNVSPNAIGTYDNTPKSLSKNIVFSQSGSATLYVDVSGASPDADITVSYLDLTTP